MPRSLPGAGSSTRKQACPSHVAFSLSDPVGFSGASAQLGRLTLIISASCSGLGKLSRDQPSVLLEIE